MLRSSLENEMSFEEIRYSTVWEDPLLLENALGINGEDRILSIGSAGCNVLHLLTLDPREITAIDISPAQTAVLALKLEAIPRLGLDEFRELIAPTRSGSAVDIYRRLRPSLEEKVRAYWDHHLDQLEFGLVHTGRLERYFKRFREEFLPRVWPPQVMKALLNAADVEEQTRIIGTTDMNLFRQAATRFFGKEDLARHGRDPAQFKFVETENTGGAFFSRFTSLLERSLIRENYFLHFFLTGRYPPGSFGPRFLQDSHYRELADRVSRVHILQQDLESHLSQVSPGTYSKANLSDVFEYMSADHSARLFGLLGRSLETRGRIAYWNLFVPRIPGAHLGLHPLSELSEKLKSQDRLWFYENFHVYRAG